MSKPQARWLLFGWLYIPTWQFLIGIGVLGGITYLILLVVLNWNPSDTDDGLASNDPQALVPASNPRLDAFRARWDIYGRFESWPTLLPFAEMSRTAFELRPDAAQEFKRWGFETTTLISSPLHSQRAYVVRGEDVAVVVFRGSDDAQDWFTDADRYLHAVPYGKLHAGMATAYSSLQARVVNELANARPKHIWLTGYSLGGALALICALDLTQYQDMQIDGVMTFAQPMIGDDSLALFLQAEIGDRYVHVVNDADVLPFLPQDYAHSGLLLRFTDGIVQKSSSYFAETPAGARTLAADGTPQSESTDYGIKYRAVDGLPALPRELANQFAAVYDGEKPPIVDPLLNPLVSPGTHTVLKPALIPTAASAALFHDHSPERYIEKLREAVDAAIGDARLP